MEQEGKKECENMDLQGLVLMGKVQWPFGRAGKKAHVLMQHMEGGYNSQVFVGVVDEMALQGHRHNSPGKEILW